MINWSNWIVYFTENDNRNKKSKANIIIEKSDDDLDEDGIGDEEDDNIDMYAEWHDFFYLFVVCF